jgi:peptidoglycan/LPS O-acetylase OafA/YrhL
MRPLARWTRPVAWSTSVAVVALLVWRRELGTEDPVVVTIGLSLLVLLFGAVVAAALPAPRLLARRKAAGASLTGILRAIQLWDLRRASPDRDLPRCRALGVPALSGMLGSQLAAQAVAVVTGTELTVALSLLNWHLLESPFLNLKRHFDYVRSDASRTGLGAKEKGSDRGIGDSS